MSEWTREANVDCVAAPCCGFVFAAEHTDVDGGGYSCPACENIRLRDALREILTIIKRPGAPARMEKGSSDHQTLSERIRAYREVVPGYAEQWADEVAALEQERKELLAMEDMLAVASEKGLAQLRELTRLREAIREWSDASLALAGTPTTSATLPGLVERLIKAETALRALTAEQGEP